MSKIKWDEDDVIEEFQKALKIGQQPIGQSSLWEQLKEKAQQVKGVMTGQQIPSK